MWQHLNAKFKIVAKNGNILTLCLIALSLFLNLAPNIIHCHIPFDVYSLCMCVQVIKRIPLEGMRVEMLNDPDMRHGFQIISTCKSFRLEARYIQCIYTCVWFHGGSLLLARDTEVLVSAPPTDVVSRAVKTRLVSAAPLHLCIIMYLSECR